MIEALPSGARDEAIRAELSSDCTHDAAPVLYREFGDVELNPVVGGVEEFAVEYADAMSELRVLGVVGDLLAAPSSASGEGGA
jgi:hypothetical protein